MAGNEVKMKKSDVMSTLLKRAMGYTVEEIVEEYAGDDRGGELIKRKVTTKPVPPDITALKTYIELSKQDDGYSSMTDSELMAEKERLISEFVNEKKKGKGHKLPKKS